jgi:hypothetical protein
MTKTQKSDHPQNCLSLLLCELHELLTENKQQLEQAGVKDELDKVLEWTVQASEGKHAAEDALEHEGFDLLKAIKACLELTGRGYMVLENESPTIAPPQELDPQTFFEARNKILEIIDTVLQLKIKHEWKGADND